MCDLHTNCLEMLLFCTYSFHTLILLQIASISVTHAFASFLLFSPFVHYQKVNLQGKDARKFKTLHMRQTRVYQMKKRDEPKSEYKEHREHVTEQVARRLLLQLRFHFILMLIEFVVIVVEVLNGSFALTSAIFVGAVGLVIGILTRRHRLSWDERTNTVAGSTDVIEAVILACYSIFVLTKPDILGLYEQGHQLLVALVALSAGTQLGGIIGTRRGIRRLQQAVGA